ncbi:hypothetical protein [Mycobacteroides salmoniphilum]|uniref:hypothetical protein n=1 Tax=Mycobacteroides salmoniphilum TaxID=404941 RepID=UPI003987C356
MRVGWPNHSWLQHLLDKDTITVAISCLAGLCAVTGRIGGSALVAGIAAVVWAAPAYAGPTQPGPQAPGNAESVITALKLRGDQVVINRNGPKKPLSECTATSVRVGRHIYRYAPQRKGPPTRSLDSHVMYVTVQC